MALINQERYVDFGTVRPSTKYSQISGETGSFGTVTATSLTTDTLESSTYYAIVTTEGRLSASPGSWIDIITDGGLTWTVDDVSSGGVTATSTSITVNTTGVWDVSASVNIEYISGPGPLGVFNMGVSVNDAASAEVLAESRGSHNQKGNLAGSLTLSLTEGDTVELKVLDIPSNTIDFDIRAVLTLNYVGF